MKKYRVVVTVEERYVFHVEAENEEEAGELACDMEINAEENDGMWVEDRRAEYVEEVKT